MRCWTGFRKGWIAANSPNDTPDTGARVAGVANLATHTEGGERSFAAGVIDHWGVAEADIEQG